MVSALALMLAISAHPMHSSLTTVTWRPDAHRLELAVRLFTQDLDEVLARQAGTACSYVQTAVTLRDAAGRVVPTISCAVERHGDVSWVRLATAPGVSRAVRLSNALLFDLFRDQINIVQSNIAGRTRTLLFTPGDEPQALT